LEQYIPLVKQVIDQAYRRLVLGERLYADEKIVSLFEPHTDILVKGLRDVAFGHKICITEGASSLILDVNVLDGNPADSELVPGVIDRHMRFYNAAPKEAVFDGCFASAANRDYAKQNGIEELTFSKNRYLDINSLVSSSKVHARLRNFRAGIEACISYMKRVFGWRRILDKGKQSFSAAIQVAAVAYNLTVLARFRLRSA
jgi:transposase, IS5 family